MPVFSFSSLTCRNSFLKGGVSTQADGLSLDVDNGSPAALLLVDACMSCAVVLVSALVAAVHELRHFAQILPAVIRAVAVDVVNLFRPAPVHDGKSDPVGLDVLIVDRDVGVPVAGADVPGRLPGVLCVPRLDVAGGRLSGPPSENPCVGAVVEKVRHFFSVHSAPPSHNYTTDGGVI